jgi:SAM-dependent methyltransferase
MRRSVATAYPASDSRGDQDGAVIRASLIERALSRVLRLCVPANSSRYRLWQENAAFAARIPPGAKVLDAGAGDAPYKPLLSHVIYESADFEKVDKLYAQSTYVCDLASIPVPDCRYDFIFFNQVMEHVPDPQSVLRELFRVLKPGGQLIYSAPFFYEEHEVPYDFYRYTQFGVRHLFTSTGFVLERLDWLEGYFATVGHQMSRMAMHIPIAPRDLYPGLAGWLLAPVMALLKIQLAVLSALFHALEKGRKYTAGGHPKNYIAIAVRPDVAVRAEQSTS